MKRSAISIYLFAFLAALMPGLLKAGGFIVVSPSGQPQAVTTYLECREQKAEVNIEERLAITEIDQTFYNPSNSRLEGYFIFPIPENSVIKKFTMFINGQETEAELLEASKAKKIYEDIVRSMKDPALLEYSNQGLFRVRIFPIEPRSEKRIRISYSEVLPMDAGTMEYTYGLKTRKFSQAKGCNFSIKVNVNSKDKIKNLYCPTHIAEINSKSAHKSVVGFESSDVNADQNFRLYYSTDNSKIGMSMLSYKKRKEDGYYFLSMSPGFEDESIEVVNKDITFILDVSGSMAGDKLKQAKKALLFCIENLNEGDCFDIVRFSTEAEALFQGPKEATEANKQEARDFVEDLRAIGGTNIEEAMQVALDAKSEKTGPADGRPHLVIFITDGKPTIGETQEEALLASIRKSNSAENRIFTFGIGNEINTHLLDKITAETQAYRSYITPKEDIEVKISNFYTKVNSPVLTDLRVTFSAENRVFKSYPRKLPDLFKGSSLTLMGRYQVPGEADVILEGKINGKPYKKVYAGALAEENEKHDFIPPLWASRCIGYLLDQIRLNGENKELVDEVTALAKEHGIITPYTSYLILEDERQLVIQNRTGGGGIPILMPMEDVEESEAEMVMDNMSRDFKSMNEKSGETSVRSSMEVQSMNQATNIADTRQGQNRMGYVDRDGNSQNLVANTRNVNGRAFYQQGTNWVDSHLTKKSNQKLDQVKVKYGSKEYFELLNKDPEIANYLAIGQNVNFVHKNKNYVVF